MLSLDTLLTYDGNKISSVVAYKETATDITLSTRSAHHTQVHLMWPQAYVTRIFNLTTDHDKAISEIGQFLARLQRNFAAPEVINATISKSRDLIRGAVKLRKDDERKAWMILPFHPLYSRTLTQAVVESNNSSAKALWMLAFQDTCQAPPPPRVSIGWCNKHPTLEQWFSGK
jgi:hypothetical protein